MYIWIYQVEHRNLHHTLIEVCRSVLDNLHRNYFLGFQILAFHHLSEGTLAKNIKYKIPVPRAAHQYRDPKRIFRSRDLLVPFVFVTQYIIDKQDIVTVLVVIPVVLDSFARLSKNSSWVSR